MTRELTIPTIGIGAGVECDGQVLVYHDLLGYQEGGPRFVKQYARLGPEIQRALEAYAADVRAGSFPEQQHTYSMPEEELAAFVDSLLEAEQRSER
jgi:3-methyl-2-oxobutanoate hydroxymethyltransferase